MRISRIDVPSVAVLAVVLLSGCPTKGGGGNDLATLVSATVRDSATPGMAVALVSTDTIRSSVSGVRKAGEATPLAATDRFHLGSNIKAVTATLAALLVESGVMQWSTTLADAFPELSVRTRAEYRNVTLQQLLAHRGGFLPLTEPAELLRLPTLPSNDVLARRQLTTWLLEQPSVATPGLASKYSNAGYVIAAAMMEKRTGQSYEILLNELILRPLSITPQFDWPAAGGADQPWGHERVGNRWMPNDPHAIDNQFPRALTPAGNISLSVTDYAKFIQAQLRGLRGAGGSLSAASYRHLHTPLGEFALGWIVRELSGIGTSAHDGSAGTFYALAAIQPERNRAVVVLVNAHSDSVANTANALALKILELAP